MLTVEMDDDVDHRTYHDDNNQFLRPQVCHQLGKRVNYFRHNDVSSVALSTRWRRGVVVTSLVSINEVNLR